MDRRRLLQATPTISIVIGAGGPTGLVGSLSRPGGNITGVTGLTLQLGPKLRQ
jgi:putative ABC transport system substrate-binding protein